MRLTERSVSSGHVRAFQKPKDSVSLADDSVDMLVPREVTCDSNPDIFLIGDTLKLNLVEVIVVC